MFLCWLPCIQDQADRVDQEDRVDQALVMGRVGLVSVMDRASDRADQEDPRHVSGCLL